MMLESILAYPFKIFQFLAVTDASATVYLRFSQNNDHLAWRIAVHHDPAAVLVTFQSYGTIMGTSWKYFYDVFVIWLGTHSVAPYLFSIVWKHSGRFEFWLSCWAALCNISSWHFGHFMMNYAWFLNRAHSHTKLQSSFMGSFINRSISNINVHLLLFFQYPSLW